MSDVSMTQRIVRFLWGDLTKDEYRKFGILAPAMMFIIGTYWMLRITKDPVFNMFVGYEKYAGHAKMVSPLVMLLVVLFYSKLVDLFKRTSLIYLMCALYGIAFIAIGFLIEHPDLVSVSPDSIFYPLVCHIPGRGLGWFVYLLLESYGSLLIALFYSFVASVMSSELAKKGYGFLFVFIQASTLAGAIISRYGVKYLGFFPIYMLGGIFVLIAPLIVTYYNTVFASEIATLQEAHPIKKKNTGFLEGARLILTNPYVMGIFVVAAFYEIISTIIEYQMSCSAIRFYGNEEAGAVLFNAFKASQGFGINLISFVFALIGGTSIFMRKFGIKFCLIAFPVTIGIVVAGSYLMYSFGLPDERLMWILLAASMTIKGLNYALNKPTSEVLYVPTSKDVKFKSKGWIDMFGLRATKGVGGYVNKVAPMMLYGTVVSFGVIGVWIFIAALVGNAFNKLQAENKVIE